MLAVETRSAELPRVADGEMAAGDEYCGTKCLPSRIGVKFA